MKRLKPMTAVDRRVSSRRDSSSLVERYGALLRALPDLMFIQHKNGTYTDFWAGTEEDLAVPRDEVIGVNIRDIGFSPRDLKDALAAIETALTTGETQTYEYELNTLQGRGCFEARIVRLNHDEVLTIVRNISARKEAERKLREATRQLEEDKRALLEKNLALEEILSHLERERRRYRHEISEQIGSTLLPILDRAISHARPAEARVLTELREQIDEALSDQQDPFLDRYSHLSPREMELCNLLKDGLSSKQISDRLNLSLTTVHKHREQIRRKLGFRNKRVNLTAYLKVHHLPPNT